VAPVAPATDIGVHGKSVESKHNELWIKNFDISMGLVNTNALAMRSRHVAEHELSVDQFVTHEFSLDQMHEAYDVIDNELGQDGVGDLPSALNRSTSMLQVVATISVSALLGGGPLTERRKTFVHLGAWVTTVTVRTAECTPWSG
jgi:hypothetical protein